MGKYKGRKALSAEEYEQKDSEFYANQLTGWGNPYRSDRTHNGQHYAEPDREYVHSTRI